MKRYLTPVVILMLAAALLAAAAHAPAAAQEAGSVVFRHKNILHMPFYQGPGTPGCPECEDPGDDDDDGHVPGDDDDDGHVPVTLLQNADWETASQQAWRRESDGTAFGTPTADITRTDKLIGGSRAVQPGDDAHGTPVQVVTVPEELEAAGFAVSYNWLQKSANAVGSGTVEAVFLNADMEETGRIAPPARSYSPVRMWVERTADGQAPAGTRHVRMRLAAETVGARFDNIDLRINGVRYSTINGQPGMERPQDRLFDASAVHGPNGNMSQMFDTRWWRRQPGSDQYFLNLYTNPFHGLSTWRFAVPNSGGLREYDQHFFVGDGHDGQEFWLEWFQDGSGLARVRAEFYSRYEGVLLGELAPEWARPAYAGSAGTMAFRTASANLPAGTAFVRVVMEQNRSSQIADVGAGIGSQNWARRGMTESSGLPTTCEDIRIHNGSFTDIGDGAGYLRFWGNNGWRVNRYEAPDGNTAPYAEYSGYLAQNVCIPRHLQPSFGGLYWAFNHIRNATSTNGGRFDFHYYDGDLNPISTWSGEPSMIAGPSVAAVNGWTGAYGTSAAPAQNLRDVSYVRISSFKNSNHNGSSHWIFDDVAVGRNPVSLPDGAPDWESEAVQQSKDSAFRR